MLLDLEQISNTKHTCLNKQSPAKLEQILSPITGTHTEKSETGLNKKETDQERNLTNMKTRIGPNVFSSLKNYNQ